MPGQTGREKRVYVGQTGKTVAERFAQHKAGGRHANHDVARYGRRLLPDLYRNVGPFCTREAAELAEAELAQELRRRGYVVPGKHGQAIRVITAAKPKAPSRSRGRAPS